jgi:hypothetical protein
MKLHTYGLLRNSFRPSQEVRTMRTYWRQRNDLIRTAVSHIQRIQKALTQMSIQLANVLSDVSGVTGQAILKAILAGEGDPHKLAALRDPRVKASEEQIARYLEGNWQEDLLFVLKQEQKGSEFCQQQMAECDRQLEQYLQQREDRSQGASLPKEMRKGRLVRRKGNKPAFALRAELFRITRYGPHPSRRHRCRNGDHHPERSGMGYEPMERRGPLRFLVAAVSGQSHQRQQGLGKRSAAHEQRASIALKMAASTLRASNTYLGAQFRRFRTNLGAPVAIKAGAIGLPHAPLRDEIRRPGSEILRGPTPRATDRTAQMESRQVGISRC